MEGGEDFAGEDTDIWIYINRVKSGADQLKGFLVIGSMSKKEMYESRFWHLNFERRKEFLGSLDFQT